MRTATTVLAALWLILAPTLAHAWSSYGNARFGYSIDIPTGFSPVAEADNGDGGVSTSADQKSLLTVWGGNLLDESLAEDFRTRLEALRGEGWDISYSRNTAGWASWSGSRQGRVLYGHAILLCDDQAAYFQFDYPQAELEAYKPVVERLVESFQNGQQC